MHMLKLVEIGGSQSLAKLTGVVLMKLWQG